MLGIRVEFPGLVERFDSRIVVAASTSMIGLSVVSELIWSTREVESGSSMQQDPRITYPDALLDQVDGVISHLRF